MPIFTNRIKLINFHFFILFISGECNNKNYDEVIADHGLYVSKYNNNTNKIIQSEGDNLI